MPLEELDAPRAESPVSPAQQGLLHWLSRWGLSAPVDAAPLQGSPSALAGELLRLATSGRLSGALSLSLRLLPDEAVGPLTHAMGGAARRLRVADVSARSGAVELAIAWDGLFERWELEGLEQLIHNLNDLLRESPDARLLAVLGEWEDALVVLPLPREALAALLRERFFSPRNSAQLSRIALGESG